MFEKKFLFLQLVLYSIRLYGNVIRRSVSNSLRRLLHRVLGTKAPPPAERKGSIVIVGASFAGYHAAHVISTSLPPDSPYDVVVIEPNSHFQFTWVLPRFSVVEGHERKAFIPYGPYLEGAPEGLVRWIRDRVVRVDRNTVRLGGGEEIPYAFLILATGSAQQNNTLPSRVGAEDIATGVGKLRGLQTRIREANRVVVLGGGAAGVELAADTKELYPHKEVILVHSRDAVMHRFGPELQAAALEGLQRLGVEVILQERASRDALNGSGECLLLGSGRVLKCDCVVDCTGQKPMSHLLAELSPQTISESGHVRVRPTMQIADSRLANVYACGDVIQNGSRNPNARTAMKQAMIAADNVLLAALGQTPRYQYKPHWADGVIKLTLGLTKSVTHFGGNEVELLFPGTETDLALMCDGAWRAFGAVPFDDSAGY